MFSHTPPHYCSLKLFFVFAGQNMLANIGSSNQADTGSLLGRKLQQLDLGSLGALPAMDVSDMGQNAMQSTLQVRAVPSPLVLKLSSY